MVAVLFDLDGVILQERSLRAATGREVASIATERALADLGVSDLPDRFLDATRFGSYDHLVDAIRTFDIDAAPEQVWPRRERYLSVMECESLRTGGRQPCEDLQAIEALSNTHTSLGIVSNARHRTVRSVVEQFDLGNVMAAIRGQSLDPDDWYKQKPKPDYLLEALDIVDADSGWYIGDSESDVLAAHRAGLESVFVRRDHTRDVDLAHRPTHEIETLYDLDEIVNRGR